MSTIHLFETTEAESPQTNAITERITPPEANYLDHEFKRDDVGNLWMVFQERTNAYVARVDEVTGRFRDSADGKDYLVAQHLSPISDTGKGPSLVSRANGTWGVVYNRKGRFQQIWLATPTLDSNGIPTDWSRRAITADDQDRINVLPALDSTLGHFRLTYRGADFAWLSESSPTTDNVLRPTMSGSSRWSTNGRIVTSIRNAVPREIYATDTDLNTTTQITDDGADKFDPYAVFCPEIRNQLLVMAIVDLQFIRIYRPGSPYYTRHADILPPPQVLADFPNSKWPQSPEFYVTPQGRTYVVTTWKSSNDPILDVESSEIWAHSIHGDEHFRLSPAALRGSVCHEGEAFAANGRTLVWFQNIDRATGQTHINVTHNGFPEAYQEPLAETGTG